MLWATFNYALRRWFVIMAGPTGFSESVAQFLLPILLADAEFPNLNFNLPILCMAQTLSSFISSLRAAFSLHKD